MQRIVVPPSWQALAENWALCVQGGMAGSKRKQRIQKATAPIDIVVENMAELLIGYVDEWKLRDAEARFLLASALMKMEAVSASVRRLIKQDKRLPYYRFFYHAVLMDERAEEAKRDKRELAFKFCDATFGVSLFHGSFGSGMRDPDRVNTVAVVELFRDRLSSAKHLITPGVLYAKEKAIQRWIPNDLPDKVGTRVAALVGRVRFMTQRMALKKPSFVSRCQLHGCGSTCFVASKSTAECPIPPRIDEHDSGTDSDDNADADGDACESYWSTLLPVPHAKMPALAFCTTACELAYAQELRCAVPFSVDELSSSSAVKVGKLGLSRVAAEARSCWLRNIAQARSLREARRSYAKREFHTIPTHLFNALHADVRDVVNIDLALVVAAASLAESANQAHGRQLPGTAPDWRADAKKWRRSIDTVRTIYRAHCSSNEGIACEERIPPPWLTAVIQKAEEVFPRCER